MLVLTVLAILLIPVAFVVGRRTAPRKKILLDLRLDKEVVHCRHCGITPRKTIGINNDICAGCGNFTQSAWELRRISCSHLL